MTTRSHRFSARGQDPNSNVFSKNKFNAPNIYSNPQKQSQRPSHPFGTFTDRNSRPTPNQHNRGKFGAGLNHHNASHSTAKVNIWESKEPELNSSMKREHINMNHGRTTELGHNSHNPVVGLKTPDASPHDRKRFEVNPGFRDIYGEKKLLRDERHDVSTLSYGNRTKFKASKVSQYGDVPLDNNVRNAREIANQSRSNIQSDYSNNLSFNQEHRQSHNIDYRAEQRHQRMDNLHRSVNGEQKVSFCGEGKEACNLI